MKMTNYRPEIPGNVFYTLFLFSLCLLCTPVMAGETFTIDPIPDQVIWNEDIKVTGTMSPGDKAVFEYYFHSADCFDENEKYVNSRSGSRSGTMTTTAGSESTWWFKVRLNDIPPGDYIFAVWKQGDEENKTVRYVHVRDIAQDETMIEFYTPEKMGPAIQDEDSFYWQNCYATANSGMNLNPVPDLSYTDGKVTKGQFLLIDGKGVAGKEILVWICRKGVFPGNVYKKSVILETDDEGFINTDNELLSANETGELLSGQYFIYAISGTEEELHEIESGLCSSAIPGDYLKANEDQNPYQQFVLLLKEPWITFSGVEYGYLPDAVHGSVVNISGTTNLKAGTMLKLLVGPSVNRDSETYTAKITDIQVNDGDLHTWSVKYDTSGLGTGEFIVKIADPKESADAVSMINIYDPAYSVDNIENDSLLVESFRVDPETKDISEDKASSTVSAISTAVLVFETVLVLVIIGCAIIVYKKR